MPGIAHKAQVATALVSRMASIQNLEEKRVYVERLDELWPDIFCRVDDDGRLRVWVLDERVAQIPKALAFHAWYIERVFKDGTARVDKDKIGFQLGQRLARATIEPDVWKDDVILPDPPTAWERLGDEDWLQS